MSNSSRSGPTAKPIAIVIAAQMRISMPKTTPAQRPAPVNVKHALKNAANSSPAAKAAFKRAAPSVKAATPHLKALAQPGKSLLSSLRHGVSAMHSLRQVTREMAKERPSPLSSVKSAFDVAAKSSPAAAAAFKRAGPAATKAQQHVEALSRLQSSPKPSLLSSLGHGVQAMRSLRQVTKEMRRSAPEAMESTMKTMVSSPMQPHHHQEVLAKLHAFASMHTGDAPGGEGRTPAPGSFAVMLIARRNGGALSPFKGGT